MSFGPYVDLSGNPFLAGGYRYLSLSQAFLNMATLMYLRPLPTTQLYFFGDMPKSKKSFCTYALIRNIFLNFI